MKCVKITSIKTNLDNYVADQPTAADASDQSVLKTGAAKCNLATTAACRYYYNNEMINLEHCECSLQEMLP